MDKINTVMYADVFKNNTDTGFSIALQHPVSKRTLFPTNMCPARSFNV